ncbi:conserved protein of unknown function [Bartonella clarridgeiae 73]|uniref:LPS-assembly lipoprotein n=1 Tax=Bartonella clarridgeiae (strain CCUG 45776 / CIP 104772 / 73) TaxID=696125 RepID=E6YJB2_BARC7|nr:hypothetical protein [Bartonella clarridgeiae]WCR55814.1 MAG: hypothetical protein PG977_001207 [Bartonella clarridgeiae]CBI76950.1 conserved protein of unknown function [Bartonella clarridgeiae 73]
MSLFNGFIVAVFSCLFTFLSGCTIEPLYRHVSQVSTPTISLLHGGVSERISTGLSEKLAAIVIEEPSDHFSQMVRNHLLFLLYGHGGKPSVPVYQLLLQTSVFTRTSVEINSDREGDRIGHSSVGTIVSRAAYILKNMKNEPVAKGTGTMSASFDRLRQEYATVQAEKNAQKRVAEELAERIFMLLAKDLAKISTF